MVLKSVYFLTVSDEHTVGWQFYKNWGGLLSILPELMLMFNFLILGTKLQIPVSKQAEDKTFNYNI